MSNTSWEEYVRLRVGCTIRIRKFELNRGRVVYRAELVESGRAPAPSPSARASVASGPAVSFSES